MPVPIVNLRVQLEATRPQWQQKLEELFARMQFILGEQVGAFEREFAAAMGARFAVGVGNGATAIELCLREAGLAGSGREVITSALTSPFTAIAILAAGCRPRFADVDPDTLQIDADDAGNRIGRRTAAVVPVHLYGQPCAIDLFARLARDHGLKLIQDACQAHGARFQGKPFTQFSPYVAYSFYPTKNLGCVGDGGAVLTSRLRVADRLRQLRDGGRRGGQVAYLPGINSRLDEMQACYLRAFLPALAEWNASRAQTARFYDEALGDCPGVRLVKRTADSVCHLYVIRAWKRNRLRQYLAEKGIVTAIHYPLPLHLHPAFAEAGLRRGALPHAEKACREIVTLPLWPYLPQAAAEEVVQRVWEFYRGPAH